jgi:predicted phosphoribosyltransferase/dienelactone hydrolase
MSDVFRDRADAGRRLAQALAGLPLQDPVVLALPRGGVPVALEVARRLGAPLDLLLVRKIGAPAQPELAVAAVADGDPPVLVFDDETAELTGATRPWIEERARSEQGENRRRRQAYLHGRPPLPVAGRTVVVVDDGIATGTTVRAALKALRTQQPARLVLAVPVAPPETLAAMRPLVDDVVCLSQPPYFRAVGAHYRDFEQVSDAEVVECLARTSPAAPAIAAAPLGHSPAKSPRATVLRDVRVGAQHLPGVLAIPDPPLPGGGIVVFAHGSGSSRHSPRNRQVAAALQQRGLGTLLFDLLRDDEQDERRKVFDIPLLATRLEDAIDTLGAWPETAGRPLGLFGASTGAAAALVAAAARPQQVAAVVSRGGRPDLAGAALARVRAPTLLIVGGDDVEVLALNEQAAAQLRCLWRLEVVPGASHLFAEPGTLERAATLAGDWLARHLAEGALGTG